MYELLEMIWRGIVAFLFFGAIFGTIFVLHVLKKYYE
jgi:hypothetical protein